MRILTPFLLSTVLATASAHAAPPTAPADARPALLQALDGDWIMTGDVMGKPARYDIRRRNEHMKGADHGVA